MFIRVRVQKPAGGARNPQFQSRGAASIARSKPFAIAAHIRATSVGYEAEPSTAAPSHVPSNCVRPKTMTGRDPVK